MNQMRTKWEQETGRTKYGHKGAHGEQNTRHNITQAWQCVCVCVCLCVCIYIYIYIYWSNTPICNCKQRIKGKMLLKLPAPFQPHSSDLSCNDGWTTISLNVVFYHSSIVLESLAWFPETPQYNRERLYVTSHCVSVHRHTIHRPWASNSNHTKQRQVTV